MSAGFARRLLVLLGLPPRNVLFTGGGGGETRPKLLANRRPRIDFGGRQSAITNAAYCASAVVKFWHVWLLSERSFLTVALQGRLLKPLASGLRKERPLTWLLFHWPQSSGCLHLSLLQASAEPSDLLHVAITLPSLPAFHGTLHVGLQTWAAPNILPCFYFPSSLPLTCLDLCFKSLTVMMFNVGSCLKT